MKADGAVLVINQNGIVFGAGSQINVRGLITTSLELGPTSRQVNNQYVLSTLKQRNDIFLALGLLGGADAYALANPSQTPQVVFGSQGVPIGSSRSEEHTSELQSLMRISYAVLCLNKKI